MPVDIFSGDAFGLVRMTQSINDLKFVPGRVDELGLFEVDRTDTTMVSVEKQGDLLVIVPPSARGGPGSTLAKVQSDIRVLKVPHFEVNDSVMAEEVQNVRAFGTENALETVMGKIAQRQRIHANSFAATEEHARLGAIKGIVSYADGSSLNLFTEFGVTQEPEINFDLANASPTPGTLRATCVAVQRKIMDNLGGIPITGFHAFCDDAFFDALLRHPEVRATYTGWSEAQILRESYIGPNRKSYGIFEFGGIVWENYRGGSVPGAKTGTIQTFIGTDKCNIFPTGVPGLFKTVYAPADYSETVNTLGERLYSMQHEMANKKGYHLDSQMNALQYCSRPKVLMQGRRA